MSRSKGKNFKVTEKLLLKKLVHSYKHMLDKTASDGVFSKERNKVWDSICVRFNAEADEPREVHSLKILYKNMRASSRRSTNNRNMNLFCTDGSFEAVEVAKLMQHKREGREEPVKNGDGNDKLQLSDTDEEVLKPLELDSESESLQSIHPSTLRTSIYKASSPMPTKLSQTAREEYFLLKNDNVLRKRRYIIARRDDDVLRREEEKAAAADQHQYIMEKMKEGVEAQKMHQQREVEAHSLRMRLQLEGHQAEQKRKSEIHMQRQKQEKELHELKMQLLRKGLDDASYKF